MVRLLLIIIVAVLATSALDVRPGGPAADAASSGRAALQESPAITVNQVDATGYPDVRVVATVLDAAGLPVSGITSFTAVEDGEPMQVVDVQAARDEQLRLSVVIAIDTSGSMAGAPIAAAKAAATQFVEAIGANDEAAIVSFAAGVRTVVPFTSDKAALAAGIAGLQAEGATSLFEAVQTTAFAAITTDAPRKAVVLLSDGQNDSPLPATAAGSIQAARGARLPMFTIGFGEQIDAPYLALLADETGGEFLPASSGDVGAVYGRIAELLRSQYVLTLRAPGEADGAASTLRLETLIDGATATSNIAAFQRGTAVAQPTAAPRPTAVASSADEGGTSGTNIAAIVVGVVVAAGAALTVLVVWARLRRQRKLREAQLATVAPNPGLASAQGVPAQAAGTAVRNDAATAWLVSLSGNGSDARVRFGGEPLTIGSAPDAAVRVVASPDVAGVHAQVWMKDGKIMLRHLASGARRTTVDGRPVEWVILEDGDVFVVGTHKWRVSRDTGP